MEKENYKIYGLIVIGDEKLRYIGLTKNSLRKRLVSHKSESKRRETYKDRWVRKNDYNIEINLIEENIPNLKEANEREVYWIKYYRDLGYDLVNTSDGGDGTSGVKPTQAQKDYLSSLYKGVPLSEEHKKKISDSHKNKVLTEEHKDKLKKSKQNVSEETRYKMKMNKYGVWLIKNKYIDKENNLTNSEIIELREKVRFESDEIIRKEKELKRLEFEKQKEEKDKLKQIKKQESNLKAELKHQEVLERKKLKEENLKNKIELGLIRVIEKEDGNKIYVPVMTDEQKQNIIEYNRHKIISEETKIKQVESRQKFYEENPDKRYKPTKEQKEHLRKINTGKKYSEETKLKHSIHSRGNGNGCAKISEDDVREIRRLFESGEKSQKIIAEQFNMDYTSINKIIKRTLWKHVE